MMKERTITYSIGTEYNGKKIVDFLKDQGVSSKALIKLKSDVSNVCLNHEPGFINRILKENDMLTIYIREEESSKKIVPVSLPFSIVYEDEDILVINKPANMPIHPSLNNYENTLGNAVAYYFAQKQEPFIFRCINRLDRDTSGLTILAKHYFSAGLIYEQMERRQIYRTYYAIVEDPEENRLPMKGTIDLPIGRKPGSTIERMIDPCQGDPAITHYEVLSHRDGLSLLKLHLETGRTHQIRVHMLSQGHPLIGDFLYNPQDKHMARQALHAKTLRFQHPITKEWLEFDTPLPKDMANFFDETFL